MVVSGAGAPCLTEKHAWFSEEQAAKKLCVYVYEGADGEEVHATEVSSRGEYKSGWADACFLGQVGGFLRVERWAARAAPVALEAASGSAGPPPPEESGGALPLGEGGASASESESESENESAGAPPPEESGGALPLGEGGASASESENESVGALPLGEGGASASESENESVGALPQESDGALPQESDGAPPLEEGNFAEKYGQDFDLDALLAEVAKL